MVTKNILVMVDIMNILAFFIERRVGEVETARTLGGRGPSVGGPMEESREEEGGKGPRAMQRQPAASEVVT